MVFYLKLAGVVIKVHSIHDRVGYLCKSYCLDEQTDIAGVCDFTISVTEEDFAYERTRSTEENGKFAYSDAYLETLTVYRKISENMLKYNTFLMHGAVLGIGEDAYMFTAPSGTGKTSFMRKLLYHMDESYVINGDKPLIKSDGSGNLAYACGTPWSGKEHLNTNCIKPMKAVFLLERGEENSLQKISFSQAFPVLLQQTYRPADAALMKKTLELLSQLSKCVEFYRLKVKYYPDVKELGEEPVRMFREEFGV